MLPSTVNTLKQPLQMVGHGPRRHHTSPDAAEVRDRLRTTTIGASLRGEPGRTNSETIGRPQVHRVGNQRQSTIGQSNRLIARRFQDPRLANRKR